MAVTLHDMSMLHRVFRREFGLLPGLVRGTAPGDTGRAAVLATHITLVVDTLHAHHEGEDELGTDSMRRLPPEQLMIVLAQMAEDANPGEWENFLNRLPPPVAEAYRAHAGPAYAGYVRLVRGA